MRGHGITLQRFMSTSLAILVISLANMGDATAQNRWGLFGGVNIANMGGDMDEFGDDLAAGLEDQLGGDWTSSKRSTTGLGFGAYYFLPTSPTLGVQFEGQYIRRGVGFDISNTDIDVDTTFKIDYFEIPVLLRISPGTGQSARVVFLVGPVIGFKTGADLAVSALGEEASTDVGEGFKSTAFGAIGGVGLSVGNTTTFMLQARYYLGLSNTLDDDTMSSKSGDFGVFAGVEFPINK